MSSSRDFRRIVDGLVLVGNEFAKRSRIRESARTSGFRSVIVSSLRRSVNFVADTCGITRGTVRDFLKPVVQSNSISSHSVERSRKACFSSVDQFPHTDPSIASKVVLDARSSFKCNTSEDNTLLGNRPEVRDDGDAYGGDEDAIGKEDKHTSVTHLTRRPRERRVPSSPFSRALGFAGLGASLAWGTLQESTRRIIFGISSSQEAQSGVSSYLSQKNAERLALTLCRMRGAALKVGQMLSIQDESLMPRPILDALDIVRQGADVMPRTQLDLVLNTELGSDWPGRLLKFDYEPMAAASIGQVHRAVTKDGLEVAVKIQYPGVSDSIQSDIENLKLILNFTNLIPKGLYLDRAIKVAKEELSRECDYTLEAINQMKFRNLLSGVNGFHVPIVLHDLSSKKVLTTKLVSGITIEKVALLDKRTRDYVGKKLLELTLMELFVFRFMQTDPNWSNFLYDEGTKLINLIDFGAAREYHKGFVDDYLRMVLACSNRDRDGVIEVSKRLGFLTGAESDVMLDAHVQSGFLVGRPFSKLGGYDFGYADIMRSISNLGATMLRHRLTPPPDEAYSLHRKLSGAFLACIKLRAVVPCRELLLQVCENYQFGKSSTTS